MSETIRTQAITPAAIRRSLLVRATPERAFEVFTAGMDRWWPRQHTIGKSPLKRAVVEPFVGGRWYGEGEDGSQDEWGDVLVWDPPARLVLAWRINADWVCDPNLLTEVDLRFTPSGDGQTQVEFEHRNLERFGDSDAAVRTRGMMEGGWGSILEGFKASAEG